MSPSEIADIVLQGLSVFTKAAKAIMGEKVEIDIPGSEDEAMAIDRELEAYGETAKRLQAWRDAEKAKEQAE